jgi:hypothetical protein
MAPQVEYFLERYPFRDRRPVPYVPPGRGRRPQLAVPYVPLVPID